MVDVVGPVLITPCQAAKLQEGKGRRSAFGTRHSAKMFSSRQLRFRQPQSGRIYGIGCAKGAICPWPNAECRLPSAPVNDPITRWPDVSIDFLVISPLFLAYTGKEGDPYICKVLMVVVINVRWLRLRAFSSKDLANSARFGRFAEAIHIE